MLRRLAASATLAIAVSAAPLALAEGHGRGLGRALNQVGGKSASAPGLNRASQNMSRVGNGLNRANGLNRTNGLSRAPGLAKGVGKGAENAARGANAAAGGMIKDQATRHQKQLDIEQRNLEHRLAQAQKLRQQAEQNGNAELAANADRMEADAIKHYEDRVDQLVSKFGVDDPRVAPPTGDAPVVEGPVVAGPVDASPVGTDAPSLEINAPSVDVKIDVPEAATGSDAARSASRPWWKPKFLDER